MLRIRIFFMPNAKVERRAVALRLALYSRRVHSNASWAAASFPTSLRIDVTLPWEKLLFFAVEPARQAAKSNSSVIWRARDGFGPDLLGAVHFYHHKGRQLERDCVAFYNSGHMVDITWLSLCHLKADLETAFSLRYGDHGANHVTCLFDMTERPVGAPYRRGRSLGERNDWRARRRSTATRNVLRNWAT